MIDRMAVSAVGGRTGRGAGLRRLLPVCLLMAGGAAQAAEICGPAAGIGLTSFEIFDGPPEEQALLAPIRSSRGRSNWDLSYVYESGRQATIRCLFTDGTRREVVLTQRVRRCDHVETAKQASSLSCS